MYALYCMVAHSRWTTPSDLGEMVSFAAASNALSLVMTPSELGEYTTCDEYFTHEADVLWGRAINLGLYWLAALAGKSITLARTNPIVKSAKHCSNASSLIHESGGLNRLLNWQCYDVLWLWSCR